MHEKGGGGGDQKFHANQYWGIKVLRWELLRQARVRNAIPKGGEAGWIRTLTDTEQCAEPHQPHIAPLPSSPLPLQRESGPCPPRCLLTSAICPTHMPQGQPVTRQPPGQVAAPSVASGIPGRKRSSPTHTVVQPATPRPATPRLVPSLGRLGFIFFAVAPTRGAWRRRWRGSPTPGADPPPRMAQVGGPAGTRHHFAPCASGPWRHHFFFLGDFIPYILTGESYT